MPRRLLLLNVLLGVVGLAFAAYIARAVVAPAPLARPLRSHPAAPVQPAVALAPAPAGAYAIVASRNLFSPTRTESGEGAGAAVSNVPKPNLYGVVLRDGAPIAYLEDPVTKRVAGYRVGDAIAGGTVKSISADRVVLTRPEGTVDVQLHDPGRPRPAVPVPGQPGMPGVVPGMPPNFPQPTPAPLPLPGAVSPIPQSPATGQPAAPTPLGRRPFRPNALTSSPPGNAPAQ